MTTVLSSIRRQPLTQHRATAPATGFTEPPCRLTGSDGSGVSRNDHVDGGAALELRRRAGAARRCTRRRHEDALRAAEQDADVEAGGGQRGLRLGQRLAGQVGHHHEVDALRRRERHRRSHGRPVVPSTGLADTTVPVGTVSLNTGSATAAAAGSPPAAAVASATVQPDQRRHRPRRRPGRHHELRSRCRAGPRRRRPATRRRAPTTRSRSRRRRSRRTARTGGAATSSSRASSVSASVWVSPARSGSVRSSGPSLTTMRNGSPSASCSPAGGAVRMISPAVGCSSLRSCSDLDVPVEVAVSARARCLVAPDELGHLVRGHPEQGVGEVAQRGERADHDERRAPTATTAGAGGPRARRPGRPAADHRGRRTGRRGRREPLLAGRPRRSRDRAGRARSSASGSAASAASSSRSGPRRRRRAWSAPPGAGRRRQVGGAAACAAAPPRAALAACSLGGVLERRQPTGSVDGASASAAGDVTLRSRPARRRRPRRRSASVATSLDAAPRCAGSQLRVAPVRRPGDERRRRLVLRPVQAAGRVVRPAQLARVLLEAAGDERSGSGVGRGSFSAARTRLRPNSEAVDRSAGSGRPARSSTDANGPRSADTGISRPTRADSVATVDRAANGTAPVTASTRIRASE